SPSFLDNTNSKTGDGLLVDVGVSASVTLTLGDPGVGLTSRGQPVVWEGIGSDTLVGKVGNVTILTVHISNDEIAPGSFAAKFTVTLDGPVDHPTAGLEDLKIIAVPISSSDGQATTLQVIIEDDSPVAHLVDATATPTDDEGKGVFAALSNEGVG